jgi:hypothetical protein
MSNNENLRAGEATSISDETIRRCLLGGAHPGEQARFEELLLVDDELDKRVRLAEFELADDYSAGRLSTPEQQLFTSNFLVTEGRGQKVAVSRALRKALSRRTTETDSAQSQSRQSKAGLRLLIPRLFRFDHPVVSMALAFTALALFAGLFWLLMKSPRVTQPAVVKRQAAPSPQREYAHPVGSQSPSPPAESADPQKTAAPGEPSSVASLILQSGGQFDVKQTLGFAEPPGESDIVRLELFLESNAPASYRAELLTSQGQQTTVASELKAVADNQQVKVVWDVPARLLKAGDYQVKLSSPSGGLTTDVRRYYFRVLQY